MMDDTCTCPCLMKTDLENSADIFSFLKENYPLALMNNNLNKCSDKELRCSCCLMATALIKLSHQSTDWEQLKNKK